MNRFVFTLLLSLTFICASNCAEFCDAKSFDSVFNVGHFVHMIRCGQVWTFDPRMDEGMGGFIRDYSWYSFARKWLYRPTFSQNFYKVARGPFDMKTFRFSGFSFQEISCTGIPENIVRNCHRAIKEWNHMSVIFDNHEAFIFSYDFEFRVDFGAIKNGFGLYSYEVISLISKDARNPFWPDIANLTRDHYSWVADKANMHSALFSPHERILYMVLRTDVSETEKHFCLTYLDMEGMLYDIRKFKPPTFDWKKPYCFSGHVIGMFYDERERKSFLVGRVRHLSPQFEDQIFTVVKEGEDGPASVSPMYKHKSGRTVRHSGQVQNLLEYFGCPPLQNSSGSTRKKRSIDRSEPMSRFSWKAIHKELTEDWIELSLMFFAILLLIYLTFRLL